MGDHIPVTIVPTFTQHVYSSLEVVGVVVFPRLTWVTLQVVGDGSLTIPVCDVLLLAPLFIYFPHPTGHGPLDLSPAVRCYIKPDVYIQTNILYVIVFQNFYFLFALYFTKYYKMCFAQLCNTLKQKAAH